MPGRRQGQGSDPLSLGRHALGAWQPPSARPEGCLGWTGGPGRGATSVRMGMHATLPSPPRSRSMDSPSDGPLPWPRPTSPHQPRHQSHLQPKPHHSVCYCRPLGAPPPPPPIHIHLTAPQQVWGYIHPPPQPVPGGWEQHGGHPQPGLDGLGRCWANAAAGGGSRAGATGEGASGEVRVRAEGGGAAAGQC